ncbi:C-TERMINALLY ENCODED PEPTIDE 14 [Hibiscus trionum]|uniref:C-TERMINALLY ENCODED PEPTIDE 14 n=1 Tax=Hibiscus trionum TaxID=183268 RepID=A0A9W7IZQ6_HIBTR|nr:C-TERMINALLY ENCODED PEPTIDE 14 [Hibiscus trionum]
MTRLSMVLLIFLFSFMIFQEPSLAEARKLMNLQQMEANNNVGLREPTRAVSFSSKGDEKGDYQERLFALHLAKIDRILQSVPSPGAGH